MKYGHVKGTEGEKVFGCRLSPEEQLFREILEQFANDFVVNLRPVSRRFMSTLYDTNCSLHNCWNSRYSKNN